MSSPLVFVTRRIFPEALELIGHGAQVEVWPHQAPPTPQELADNIGQTEGLVTNVMDRVDADLLDRAPKLRVISQVAVGLDNVDVDAASRRGILVGHTPGVLAKATADLGFAILMSAARRVSESERWVQVGKLGNRLSSHVLAGHRRPRGHPGNPGLGPDGAGNGQARFGLRHESPLSLPHPQTGLGSNVTAWNTPTWTRC